MEVMNENMEIAVVSGEVEKVTRRIAVDLQSHWRK